uniref:Galectin n=1 Tax=Parascaris equorum TaxID=6256 RepID=A0A914S5C8_PAREQ
MSGEKRLLRKYSRIVIKLQIFVNGERFASFAHRVDPHEIGGLQIQGDLDITGIQINFTDRSENGKVSLLFSRDIVANIMKKYILEPGCRPGLPGWHCVS